MKQQLAAKDQELRGKEREIDLLYGSSPLTDADLRRALAEVLLQKRRCYGKLCFYSRSSRGVSFMKQPNPFKWHHFEAEIILLCVRWYLRYSLSYRDLEEMMRERGLQVDHTTIYRWVQRYAPELEKQGYETTHMIRKG